jgi:putative DNA primase/helicase
MRKPIDVSPEELVTRIARNFPQELQREKRWIFWKLLPDGKKLPCRVDRGDPAKWNEPDGFGTFSVVAGLLPRIFPKVQGISIALGDGLGGLDLDNVSEGGNPLHPNHERLLKHLDSYTEYSPSGAGTHTLFRYQGEMESRRKGEIELYFGKRFLTVTGSIFDGRRKLRDATVGAQRILQALRPPKPLLPRLPFGEAEDYSDEKLKELMFAAKNGAAIRDLWNGGNPKGTPSEGDFGLMSHLAYWTDGDPARMIRLFLQSARAERPKGQRADYLNAMARKLAGGGA